MKQWPDDKTPDYEEIIEPLHHAIFWAQAVDSGIVSTDFEYTGYDTPSTNHICLSPDEALTMQAVEQSDQSALETVLNIVFRLGYEQGKRETGLEKRAYELLAKYTV